MQRFWKIKKGGKRSFINWNEHRETKNERIGTKTVLRVKKIPFVTPIILRMQKPVVCPKLLTIGGCIHIHHTAPNAHFRKDLRDTEKRNAIFCMISVSWHLLYL